jgi:WD40 repeat protein
VTISIFFMMVSFDKRIRYHQDWRRSWINPESKTQIGESGLWPTKGGYWHCRRDVLRGHEEIVTSVAFSPRIVTASEDKTARIWDAATPKHRRTQLEATRKEIAELEQRFPLPE